MKLLTHQELNEKIVKLNLLHIQDAPDVVAIKRLEEGIGLWLEQKDLKWKQMSKRD